jgi:magnesium transporter
MVGLMNGLGFAVIMGAVAAAWFNVSDFFVVMGLAMFTVLTAAALGGIFIPLKLMLLSSHSSACPWAKP